MFVQGPDNNRIDCMFFPCTQKEEVIVFDESKKANDTGDEESSSINGGFD